MVGVHASAPCSQNPARSASSDGAATEGDRSGDDLEVHVENHEPDTPETIKSSPSEIEEEEDGSGDEESVGEDLPDMVAEDETIDGEPAVNAATWVPARS